jgi:ABC-type transporter MlaC component
MNTIMTRILLAVAFAIMSSQSQACDDQMEQQTQIMQQQLFSQQRQEQEQRHADYRADINAQEQIRQERNNAGWTNAILLDGQAKRGW